MAQFEATMTFHTSDQTIVENFAESLGWQFRTRVVESPYTDIPAPAGVYVGLTNRDTKASRLLEQMRWTAEILKGEGVNTLQQKMVCVFYDTKTNYDAITDSGTDLDSEDEDAGVTEPGEAVTDHELQVLQHDALGG